MKGDHLTNMETLNTNHTGARGLSHNLLHIIRDRLGASHNMYKNQFGFRKNHSTFLALIEVLDTIYSKIDNHETVVGIYLDLQIWSI